LIVINKEMIVMSKEIDYRKYAYRQIGEADFKEFRAACSSSPKELTEFLNIGQYMETYNVIDHWNLFSTILHCGEYDSYGLFEGKTLIGFATMSHSVRSFGCQIVYWIRNGYHGMGLGKLFMYNLLRDSLGRKGFKFAELIIDLENIPSVKIAESLGLYRIDEWEDFENGQGSRRSGRYRLYMAIDHLIELEAQAAGVEPIDVLRKMWVEEQLGLIQAIPMEAPKWSLDSNRLRGTLRFVNWRKDSGRAE
jgi:RimJ/RimL family protein N-acetyltransferase